MIESEAVVGLCMDLCSQSKVRFLSCSFSVSFSFPEKDSFPLLYLFSGASQVALVVKNLPADAGDARDVDSIPGS